ncbi:hypothetical protein QYF52_02860 [Paenibacillus polymyxa]|uniref:hypothetical protein n=1 Tax=Paenibacillus polymyxa TaxID=1406 RepID=UPI0025B6AD74|nr:hypothetical protein [Paenibacillus polymyxa]MDN4076860.1 hypothetical protein [Paenibacillus polymyxa]MDN4102286.1 hypothetical protein [Paenibacillus polymyxa]MDN4112504.1 hypothetical protein [Paenibacillus polymyxa]
MKIWPEYAQNIIVGVMFLGQWNWYVTEREYWFLNTEMEERFGIAILDETTAGAFLEHICEYKVAAGELTTMLQTLDEAIQHKDEVLEFCPTLYVDFDQKVLYSLFPEPASFEHYVPVGWKGEYQNFLEEVPPAERYWMIHGSDFFKKYT